jgi:hypothetical protein
MGYENSNVTLKRYVPSYADGVWTESWAPSFFQSIKSYDVRLSARWAGGGGHDRPGKMSMDVYVKVGYPGGAATVPLTSCP